MEESLIRRALTMAALALAICFIVGSRTDTLAQTSIDRVLYVQPDQVHVGDTIYVGGKGYEARHQEVFTVACPSLQNGIQHAYTAPTPSRRRQESNWTTDGKGQFAGWSMPILPVLVNGARLPVTCKIYASSSVNLFATNLPGPFTILPSNRSLDPSSRRMTVHAGLEPAHVHSGMMEKLTLASWPGARVDVAVSFSQLKPFRKTVRLNWDGHSSVLIPVKISLPPSMQSLKAVVEVRAHLQDRDSKLVSKNFVVVR